MLFFWGEKSEHGISLSLSLRLPLSLSLCGCVSVWVLRELVSERMVSFFNHFAFLRTLFLPVSGGLVIGISGHSLCVFTVVFSQLV